MAVAAAAAGEVGRQVGFEPGQQDPLPDLAPEWCIAREIAAKVGPVPVEERGQPHHLRGRVDLEDFRPSLPPPAQSITALLPSEEPAARQRLPLLIVLVLPWIAALVAGPLPDDFTYGGVPPPDWMIPTQYALLIASAILPLVLMPSMRGARRFTMAVGIFNLSLTLFVTVSSILILTPEL